MMENLLSPLKSLNPTWLSPGSTTFAMEMVLAFVCGVGLFLLLLPWLPGEPPLLPSRKNRNIRKNPAQMRWKSRSRKRTGALSDCQIYRKLDRTLVSLPKSLQGLFPDQGSSEQPLHQQCPADVHERAPVTAPQPYEEQVDTAALSPVEAAPSPLTRHLLPLASSPSQGLSATSSDFVCSPASLTASQPPEPLHTLERLSSQPPALSLPPPCPPYPATAPQPWWNTKEKPEEQPNPQQPSYPKILGIHSQQKWIQLFWGLPSLHSESLVATAWISQNPSPIQHPTFLFNEISNIFPDRLQDKTSPPLSQAQPLSCLEPQTPPLSLITPQFQPPALGQVQTRAHLQSPPPVVIPTETQHPGRPLLRTQAQSGWAAPSAVQSSQDGYRSFTPNLCRDPWAAAVPPEGFPISPEHWEQLEQHMQKSLNQHQQHLPGKIQESLELTQPQSDLAPTRQAKDKPGPSGSSSLSTGGCSKDAEEEKFQLEKNLISIVGHILGTVPRDLSRALESSSVKVLGATSTESERNRVRSTESDSNDENHREDGLNAHLGVKSRQIQEGLIPLRVRRSWLSLKGDFSINMQNRNLAAFRNQKPCASIFQKLPSLDPSTQKTLEAHVTRAWVRHKWSLSLKLLRAVNLFKVEKPPPLCFPQLVCPSSPMGVSWGDKVPGKLPEACPREEVTASESVPALGRLLVSPPVCKETERALTGIPPGDGQGPLMAPPHGQGSRWPSQQLTYSLTSTASESRTTLDTGRGCLEVPVVLGTCVVQDGGEPGLQADIGREFQHGVEIKSGNQSQVCAPDVHLPEPSTDSFHTADNLYSVATQDHLYSVSLGDVPASQKLGDLMAERERRLGQQKPRILKHGLSQKRESKMSAPTDKGEASRRASPIKQTDLGTCTPTQIRRMDDNLERKDSQLLPQKKPVPSEGYFQGSMTRFLLWISRKKKFKGQEEPQRKGSFGSASAQSQRPAKSSRNVDHNIVDTRHLVRGGLIQKANKLAEHKLCALELNQHKVEEGQAPVSWVPCSDPRLRPSEPRRTLGCAATQKCHSCANRQRQPSDLESLKTGHFNSQQQGRKHPHPCSPARLRSRLAPHSAGQQGLGPAPPLPEALMPLRRCPVCSVGKFLSSPS